MKTASLVNRIIRMDSWSTASQSFLLQCQRYSNKLAVFMNQTKFRFFTINFWQSFINLKYQIFLHFRWKLSEADEKFGHFLFWNPMCCHSILLPCFSDFGKEIASWILALGISTILEAAISEGMSPRPSLSHFDAIFQQFWWRRQRDNPFGRHHRKFSF